MRLFHATTAKRWLSIRRDRAILASKSEGRIRGVWLHAASRTPWACLHTVRRHGGKVQDVVVIAVDVPRRLLRRHSKGLWYTLSDVQITGSEPVVGFQVVSASEVV
jgi:hypothetical protein